MSKKGQRRGKGKPRQPGVSPVTLLRSRLDRLFGDEALATRDAQSIEAELDSAVGGLDPRDALPVLVRAHEAAPVGVRERLDETIPHWLSERGYTDALLALLARGAIYPGGRSAVRTWLQAAGVEAATVQEAGRGGGLYRAYRHSDESQGMVALLFYTDRQRVRTVLFLLDYNPPWEGAVKDIALLPLRAAEDAELDLAGGWAARGMPLASAGAAEAKTEILQALEANRREGIRLPRDLVRARQLFVEQVVTLPDGPHTPPFTAQDFDELARTGRSAEEIRQYEQTVGRRVRMEDGTEVLVMGALPDEWD